METKNTSKKKIKQEVVSGIESVLSKYNIDATLESGKKIKSLAKQLLKKFGKELKRAEKKNGNLAKAKTISSKPAVKKAVRRKTVR